MVLGVLRGRRRNGVVEGDGQPLRVLDALYPDLAKEADDRRRVVVAQHNVGVDIDYLAGAHLRQSGRAR